MAAIDLHMHSIYSDDGQILPTELVERCIKAGIKYAALTDHNSVRGVPEMIKATRWKDIEVIPAIELDCIFDGLILHILGYGIDISDPFFEENEQGILSQERQAGNARKALVRKLGIEFDNDLLESLSKDGIINGEMIAEAALLFDAKHENPLLQPYHPGGNRSDNPFVNFYWDLCSQGKPAYVEIKYISISEAIRIIITSGGVPILAHPGLQVHEDKKLLKSIMDKGVEGIEVFSSYHSAEQTQFYLDFVREYGLLISAGSDFHGKIKPSIHLGSSPCDGLEFEIIQELKQALKKRSLSPKLNPPTLRHPQS